jgi:hypothetical protein
LKLRVPRLGLAAIQNEQTPNGAATPPVGSVWTAIYDTNFTVLQYKTNSAMIGSQTATNPSATITGGIIEAIN